jgi:TetR/AcrR family acrAB operon transcriptional repressor
MARCTKEAALQTRARLLNAAREVFRQRGVSRATLEDIAKAAGVTRGAIYWHFANKGDVLQAMFDEVSIPLIDRLDDTLLQDPKTDALGRLRNFLLQLFDSIQSDDRLRAMMEICEFKCEFVGDRAADLDDWRLHVNDLQSKLTRTYEIAQQEGSLRLDLSPALAAWDTQCFLSGLIRLWLLAPTSLKGLDSPRSLIEQHVALRRRCTESPSLSARG